MTASDSFEKLKKQVDDAERAISAAVTEDEAKVGAKLDQARSSAEDRAAELRARTQEASDKAEDHWHEIQRDWDAHIQRTRQRLDQTRSEIDATVALNDAEEAEADAMDAIDFASAAIGEAEYAVLDALQAQRKAQALVAASS